MNTCSFMPNEGAIPGAYFLCMWISPIEQKGSFYTLMGIHVHISVRTDLFIETAEIIHVLIHHQRRDHS